MTAKPTGTDVLAELERLHAAATPGPWTATDERADGGAYIDPPRGVLTNPDGGAPWVGHATNQPNAALIVAAVNALPALIAAVRAVQALHAPVEWERDSHRQACPECSDPENGMTIFWPCETVLEVDRALAGAQTEEARR